MEMKMKIDLALNEKNIDQSNSKPKLSVAKKCFCQKFNVYYS